MMIIEKREVPIAILLSIVTCGIYFLYWEYKIYDSLYKANNQPSSAGVDLLLSCVTCGIYFIYMMYKSGKMESSALAMYGLQEKDDSVLYMILGIFGLGIVSAAIIQTNINNQLADAVNNAHTHHDPQRPQI